MEILRWIVALPGAIVGGWLAYIVGGTINNVTTIWALGEPLNGLAKFGLNFTNNMYLGLGIVFFAVKIAPSGPKIVGSVAATTVIVFGLMSLALTISTLKYGPVAGILGAIFGASAAMYAALMGEIHPIALRPRASEKSNATDGVGESPCNRP